MTDATVQNEAPVPFYDPHMHVWDVNTIHSVDDLGGPGKEFPRYTFPMYEAAMDPMMPFAIHVGAVHVEAIPRNDDGLAEVLFAKKDMAEHNAWQKQRKAEDAAFRVRRYTNIVGFVNLLNDNAEEQMRRMKEEGVVGLRQILNCNPNWPHITYSMVDDEKWVKRFDLVAAAGFKTFEIQVNPHQLKSAAKLAALHPRMHFILDHLGCRRNKHDAYEEWLEGITAFAQASERTHVKLSDAAYTSPEDWDTSDEVARTYTDFLRVFGPKRCMVASNYPVSLHTGMTPERWSAFLRKVLAGLPREELECVMARNAMALYSYDD